MKTVFPPEFNNHRLSDKVAVELPTYVWITIGLWLQFVDENTTTTMPNGMQMLITAINDIIFPKSFQQAQKAAYEEHKQQHMENHPLMQFMKGIPGVQIETIPNPEDFGADDNNPDI